MQSQLDTLSGPLPRHDFDGLRIVRDIDVHPARPQDVSELAAMARARVPGVTLTAEQLWFYCQFNPDTAFSFNRSGRLIGGIAFLHLNAVGLEALGQSEINLHKPDTRYLAKQHESPAAIYWWALAAHGRGIAGLGAIAARFAMAPYRGVDFYAQPRSEDGCRMARTLGFAPTVGLQNDLWTYRRAASHNRALALADAA